jgi:hypothetical protein
MPELSDLPNRRAPARFGMCNTLTGCAAGGSVVRYTGGVGKRARRRRDRTVGRCRQRHLPQRRVPANRHQVDAAWLEHDRSWNDAIADGHGDEDVAAAITALRPLMAPSANPAAFERPLAAPGCVLGARCGRATTSLLCPCPASTSDPSRYRTTYGRDHQLQIEPVRRMIGDATPGVERSLDVSGLLIGCQRCAGWMSPAEATAGGDGGATRSGRATAGPDRPSA